MRFPTLFPTVARKLVQFRQIWETLANVRFRPIAVIAARLQCRSMTGSLTLSYDFSGDPNDDLGWLTVIADCEDYRAKNGMWVQWQDVVEFAETLSQYPITSVTPVEAEWGFTENGNYTRVTFISLRPANVSEQVVVTVDLVDWNDVRRRCQMALDTTYADIASFRGELEQLMAKARDKAVLKAA